MGGRTGTPEVVEPQQVLKSLPEEGPEDEVVAVGVPSCIRVALAGEESPEEVKDVGAVVHVRHVAGKHCGPAPSTTVQHLCHLVQPVGLSPGQNVRGEVGRREGRG